jgi:hypothetical protein
MPRQHPPAAPGRHGPRIRDAAPPPPASGTRREPLPCEQETIPAVVVHVQRGLAGTGLRAPRIVHRRRIRVEDQPAAGLAPPPRQVDVLPVHEVVVVEAADGVPHLERGDEARARLPRAVAVQLTVPRPSSGAAARVEHGAREPARSVAAENARAHERRRLRAARAHEGPHRRGVDRCIGVEHEHDGAPELTGPDRTGVDPGTEAGVRRQRHEVPAVIGAELTDAPGLGVGARIVDHDDAIDDGAKPRFDEVRGEERGGSVVDDHQGEPIHPTHAIDVSRGHRDHLPERDGGCTDSSSHLRFLGSRID